MPMLLGNFAILGPLNDGGLSDSDRALLTDVRDKLTGQNPVTSLAPIVTDGDSELVAGDTTTLTFTSDAWPDLTGAVISFRVTSRQTGIIQTFPATAAQPSTQWIVSVSLTSGQTAGLELGEMNEFDLIATLSGGSTLTLITGTLSVKA